MIYVLHVLIHCAVKQRLTLLLAELTSLFGVLDGFLEVFVWNHMYSVNMEATPVWLIELQR